MEVFKQALRVGAGVLVALIVVGLVTSAITDRNTEQVSRDTGRSESQIYRDIFMDECAVEPAYESYCACTYGALLQDYFYRDLEEVSYGKNQAELLEFMLPYAQGCYYHLDTSSI